MPAMAFTSSCVACDKARFAVPIRDRIRLADIHAEHAPDQRGKETWRLPVQFVCRRLLPDSDDDDGEQDQDEHRHGAGDEDQDGQHQLLAPLPIVRSMDAAAAKIHAGPPGLSASTAADCAPRRFAGAAMPDHAGEARAAQSARLSGDYLTRARLAAILSECRGEIGMHGQFLPLGAISAR